MPEEPKKFKLKTQIWVLLGFQLLVGIAAVIFSYMLVQMKLISDGGPTGMIGTVMGSYCYGIWVEKRYPQIIETYIKKLVFSLVLVMMLIALPFVFATLFFAKITVLALVIILVSSVLFASLLGYFATYWGIKWGVKVSRRGAARLLS